jgi:hypothetical protein
MKKISLLSPLLLTLSSLLSLYYSSFFTISPQQVLFPLLFLWILTLLVAFPIYRITRDWDSTAIYLSALVITLFYSPLRFRAIAIILAVVCLTWFCLSFIFKWFRQKRVLALFLTSTGIVLVTIQVIFLVRVFLTSPLYVYTKLTTTDQAIDLSSNIKPDIYYIVLDGYARADILRDYYAFDNSKFISYLKSKGFVIAENAHSNYPKTTLSIASTLNMDYVQNFTPDLKTSDFWWLMTPFINHSQLRAVLEHKGYETFAVATDWSITDNHTVDHYFKPYTLPLNDFEGFFLNTTPIGELGKFLFRPFTSFPSYQTHRAFIENDFKSLMEITKFSGSKFVFAHIISPHPPFVFDAEGNALTPNYPFSFNDASDYTGSREQYRSQYVGQLNFVNNRIETVIDAILSNSKNPPIIVLQADHGPGMLTDFDSAENTCIRERFSILGAYYLPGLDAGIVPPDITPVNIFRIILDQYFHADLPLLENAQYYYKNGHIYNYLDVTSRITESCHP